MKKFNMILGLILLIAGAILFFNEYSGTFIFGDHLLSVSFVALGTALFFVANTNAPDEKSTK